MKYKVENLSKYFNDSDQKASLTKAKQSTVITTEVLSGPNLKR